MKKVRITYVQERDGQNGPYTRVGFRANGDKESTFVNVDGHGLGLEPGNVVFWNPKSRTFEKKEEGSVGKDEEAVRIAKSVALREAVALTVAYLEKDFIPLDKDPKDGVLRLAEEFHKWLLS